MKDSDWKDQDKKLNQARPAPKGQTCGCKIWTNSLSDLAVHAEISYCPLHANAPRLLDALEHIANHEYGKPCGICSQVGKEHSPIAIAKALLRECKGEPK